MPGNCGFSMYIVKKGQGLVGTIQKQTNKKEREQTKNTKRTAFLNLKGLVVLVSFYSVCNLKFTGIEMRKLLNCYYNIK